MVVFVRINGDCRFQFWTDVTEISVKAIYNVFFIVCLSSVHIEQIWEFMFRVIFIQDIIYSRPRLFNIIFIFGRKQEL